MHSKYLSLSGTRVRLDPLTMEHCQELTSVGLAPDLWKLQPKTIANVDDMRRYIDSALTDRDKGVAMPYVVIDQLRQEIVGSTRFMDITHQHRRLEIGATWLCKKSQGTGINAEMKFLMLREAFEVMKFNKVVFKTEALNAQSRRALTKIGAIEEGIFRKHLIADSGRTRDMMYFSILDEEWPAIKDSLARRLSGVPFVANS